MADRRTLHQNAVFHLDRVADLGALADERAPADVGVRPDVSARADQRWPLDDDAGFDDCTRLDDDFAAQVRIASHLAVESPVQLSQFPLVGLQELPGTAHVEPAVDRNGGDVDSSMTSRGRP